MSQHIYIGTKMVRAEAMDSDTFTKSVRQIPGHPIGPPTSPGYKVVYEDGYVSWSPAGAFEHAYRQLNDGEIRLLTGQGG